MHRLGVLGLALALGSCSFAFAARPTGREHKCLHSVAPPLVDAAVAIGAVGTARFGFGCGASSNADCGAAGAAFAGGMLLAALPFVASAIYGAVIGTCPSDGERAHSEQLIDSAIAAARAGDCNTVHRVHAELSRTDPDALDAFLADRTIRTCRGVAP